MDKIWNFEYNHSFDELISSQEKNIWVEETALQGGVRNNDSPLGEGRMEENHVGHHGRPKDSDGQ